MQRSSGSGESNLVDAAGNPVNRPAFSKAKVTHALKAAKMKILAAAAGVAMLATVMGNLESIQKSYQGLFASPSHIKLEYMRLFGAYQVPWLIIMNTSLAESKGSEMHEEFDPADALDSWWQQWPFRDARPLTDMVLGQSDWSNRPDPLHFFELILAEEPDPAAQRYIAIAAEAREGRMYGDYDFIDSNEIADYMNQRSHKAGFLFLIIENASEQRLEHVQLRFKRFPFDGGLYFTDSQGEPLRPNASQFPGPREVEAYLDQASEDERIIAHLGPKEKVLWLLAVYIKNKDGLPSKYVSPVVRPTLISYKDVGKGSSVKLKVRDPLGLRAVRQYLPGNGKDWQGGWMGQ